MNETVLFVFKITGGAAVAAFFTFLGTLIQARNKRRDVNVNGQPISVGKSDKDRFHDDNKDDHENIFNRLSALEKLVAAQGAKTDMMIELLKSKR